MEEYKRIINEEFLSGFLSEIDYLHDALIREVSLVSRGYVDTDGRMWGDTEPSDGRIIFHSQDERCAFVEVIFNEVSVFKIDPRLLLEADGAINQEGIIFYPSSVRNKNDSIIVAKFAGYRIFGRESSGNRLDTVSSVPILVSSE